MIFRTKINHRNIDDVDSTMDSIRDQMDMANSISDALAQPFDTTLDEVIAHYNSLSK